MSNEVKKVLLSETSRQSEMLTELYRSITKGVSIDTLLDRIINRKIDEESMIRGELEKSRTSELDIILIKALPMVLGEDYVSSEKLSKVFNIIHNDIFLDYKNGDYERTIKNKFSVFLDKYDEVDASSLETIYKLMLYLKDGERMSDDTIPIIKRFFHEMVYEKFNVNDTITDWTIYDGHNISRCYDEEDDEDEIEDITETECNEICYIITCSLMSPIEPSLQSLLSSILIGYGRKILEELLMEFCISAIDYLAKGYERDHVENLFTAEIDAYIKNYENEFKKKGGEMNER